MKQRANFRILLASKTNRRLVALCSVLVIGCIGAYFLSGGQADTPYSSVEAASGSISGSATVSEDPTASSSKAVVFGAAPAVAGCTNPLFTSTSSTGTWSTNGYFVNNDAWNSTEAGPQTMYACSFNNWYVVSNQPNLTTDPGSVKTYPDIEKLFSEQPIKSFHTITSFYNETTPNVGNWDTAYDIWANNWKNEIMIWNNEQNQGQIPPSGAINVTVAGHEYAAWQNGSKYTTLVVQPMNSSGNVNILGVLNWLTTKGWLPKNSTLTAVEYGIEISYTGGGPATFSVNNFSLSAN